MAIPEPAVSRPSLFFSAGIAWLIGAGVLTWRTALLISELYSLWPVYLGAALGVIKFMLVFRILAERNIRRIRELSPQKERICIFAFQSWSSYLIVLVMIALGLALRVIGIPTIPLAIVYALIAMALLLGSLIYFRAVWESPRR